MSDETFLTADEILAADDIPEDTVEVPEWGGKVRVRGLTLKQLSAIAQKAIRRNPQTGQDETNREISVLLTIQAGMVNPKLSNQQLQRLSEKSGAATTRVLQAINALGPTPEAVSEAEKSFFVEPDAPIPVRIGARAGNDLGPSDNGYVNT